MGLMETVGNSSISPVPLLALGVLFGLIAFFASQRYKGRHGVTPWGLPSVVWGVIGLLSLLVWAILFAIATRKSARPAPPPPGGAWSTPPPPPAAMAPGGPTAPAQDPAYDSAYGPGTSGGAGSGPPRYPTGVSAPPPAWHPDPAGRHPWRYWDGSRWTEHVSDGRNASADPL